MHWILILTIWANDSYGGSSMVVAQFYDRASCLVAANLWLEKAPLIKSQPEVPRWVGKVDVRNAKPSAFCVPNGNPYR
jgi:hypothetical protein